MVERQQAEQRDPAAPAHTCDAPGQGDQETCACGARALADCEQPTGSQRSIGRLFEQLQERSKELHCLLQVEETLSDLESSLDEVCPRVLSAIPTGMLHSDVCYARITIEDRSYHSPGFQRTEWALTADIRVHDMVLGALTVCYAEERPPSEQGPFLLGEVRLIRAVAERLGHFTIYRLTRRVMHDLGGLREPDAARTQMADWKVILDMIRRTDRDQHLRFSRKMINHLTWCGVEKAAELLEAYASDWRGGDAEDEWNQPNRRRSIGLSTELSAAAFWIAAEHLSDEEILRLIEKWIEEDKVQHLVHAVNRNLSLAEVADAIRRYHHLLGEPNGAPTPHKRGVLVALIRRFLSDNLRYVNVAKNHVHIRDFDKLLKKVIYSSESHGKLGGKAAGLFLARHIVRDAARSSDVLGDVKVPTTWYLTADVVLHFIHFNGFDDVVEQKYKDLEQVRLEYPYIVQSFKCGRFPPDIVKGLSVALDDFEDKPLIVRSSSLLEDGFTAAFSGKYKSLFLPNQGSKRQRLDALMDAIAEVYASTFHPDPIQYRSERGLLDFAEEMGIMIQEVVGERIGRYYLPSYAGVAFSNNELRWSPRIRREDGLVRIVPGLGTRAVDRVADDYPILCAPGQPGLRVNVTLDEMVRYSPRWVDVIDLETQSFQTVPLERLLGEIGCQIPGIANMVSLVEGDRLRQPLALDLDFDGAEAVVSFEGLLARTRFVEQVRALLGVLRDAMGVPVDIEFACDGRTFYLLQCRPLIHGEASRPVPIPTDVPKQDIVFVAKRHVTNGRLPDITHIVYVVPERYAALPDRAGLLLVGTAVSHLNKVLPRRKFILIGPGRWGSRGDIKLGVSVTYADICNTAALLEVARRKGNYVPDLSFGTHFFQDLVEADIRYIPLYPDDGGTFNERFLLESPNSFASLAPGFAELSDVVRVIAVPEVAGGRVLRVLANADLGRCLGMLAPPQGA